MSAQFTDSSFGDFTSSFQFETKARKAPQWPLIVGVAILVTSLLLVFVERSAQDSALLIVALIGYLLTPLATAAVLILALRNHKNLSSVDGYQEESGNTVIKRCSLIAYGGFITAIPHVWQLADYFSLVFAPGAGA